jgi:hypothetical protein
MNHVKVVVPGWKSDEVSVLWNHKPGRSARTCRVGVQFPHSFPSNVMSFCYEPYRSCRDCFNPFWRILARETVCVVNHRSGGSVKGVDLCIIVG